MTHGQKNIKQQLFSNFHELGSIMRTVSFGIIKYVMTVQYDKF